MSKSLRHGTTRPLVHAMQVEKGLQSIWRLKAEGVPDSCTVKGEAFLFDPRRFTTLRHWYSLFGFDR